MKKKTITLLVLILFIINTCNIFAKNSCSKAVLPVKNNIFVTDFGAKPYSFENAVDAINKAIEAASKVENPVLIFPKGRYDIWPEGAIRKEYFISNTSTEEECPSKIKTIGMLFKNIKNLIVEGSGSVIMCHGKMISFAIDGCDNLTIQNLSIDFERPTMSEFHIDTVTDNGVVVTIHPDSKYSIINSQLIWYGEGWRSQYFHAIELDPITDIMRYSSWDVYNKSTAEELKPNLVRFHTPKDFKPKVGTILTVRDIIRDQVGAFILHSKNVTLSNVQMYYMHGLGIVSQFSENITMKHVSTAPKAGSGRVIASSADFMHFSGCKGLIDIDSCLFSGAHDDPINIHGTHLRIIKQLADNKLIVRFMHPQSYGFEAFYPGDAIDFIHANTLTIYGSNKVKNVNKINNYEIELSLESPLPKDIETNDCIENVSCTPSVYIHGCKFSRTNTRGILITTRRKVVIEDNLFYRLGMSAILIANDAMNWYESGLVTDVLIKNNEFVDCAYNGGPGNAIIAIAPENTIVNADKPVHRNIRIENNIFKTYDYPVVFAKSTKGLSFSRNKIIRTSILLPSSSNKNTLNFEACSDVIIEGNTFEGEVLGKNIHIDKMNKKDIKLKNNIGFIIQ